MYLNIVVAVLAMVMRKAGDLNRERDGGRWSVCRSIKRMINQCSIVQFRLLQVFREFGSEDECKQQGYRKDYEYWLILDSHRPTRLRQTFSAFQPDHLSPIRPSLVAYSRQVPHTPTSVPTLLAKTMCC
jgi:hypothetical protein